MATESGHPSRISCDSSRVAILRTVSACVPDASLPSPPIRSVGLLKPRRVAYRRSCCAVCTAARRDGDLGCARRLGAARLRQASVQHSSPDATRNRNLGRVLNTSRESGPGCYQLFILEQGNRKVGAIVRGEHPRARAADPYGSVSAQSLGAILYSTKSVCLVRSKRRTTHGTSQSRSIPSHQMKIMIESIAQ